MKLQKVKSNSFLLSKQRNYITCIEFKTYSVWGLRVQARHALMSNNKLLVTCNNWAVQSNPNKTEGSGTTADKQAPI